MYGAMPMEQAMATTMIGYTRVSTGEQATKGASLAAQREALEAEAVRRGWELELYADAGLSGSSMDRPQLQAALAALAAGRADGLVVAKLDRLSRSVADFAALLNRSRRERWTLVALDLGIDTSTAAGELVANVMAAVSQWERRAIGDRTRVGLAQRRAEGVKLGRPVTLSPDVRQQIQELREDGLSFRAIAGHLNEQETPTAQGGRRWYASTVRGVLNIGSWPR